MGDLLIPCSTTTTNIDLANVTAINENDVLLGGDISILRFKKNGNSVFFAYYLTHPKKFDLAKYGQGSTIVHLYYNHFKKMSLCVPELVKEQQKIANFLTAVDTKINQLSKKQQLLSAYKKGVMQKIFSQSIRFKADDGCAFPDWQERKLGDVLSGTKGQGLSKSDIEKDGACKCILYGELYTTYQEVIKEVVSQTNSDAGVKSKAGDLLVPCSTTTTGIDLADVTVINEENVSLGGDISILREPLKTLL